MAHRQDVILAYENIDFANEKIVVAVVGLDFFDRLQHGKQRIAVLLDLRSLMAGARIFNGKRVQVELLRHLIELLPGRLEERHPDEAIGTRDVLADVLDGDIGELAAVRVDNAGDEHGLDGSTCGRIIAAPRGPRHSVVDWSDGLAARQQVTSAVSYDC